MESKMGTPVNLQPSVYPAMYPSSKSYQPQAAASAVSINIYEPKSFSGMPVPQEAPQMMDPYYRPTAPVYNYTPAPLYEMPQVPIYGQQPQTFMPPQFATMPMQQNVVSPQVLLPAPVAMPVQSQTPVVNPVQDVPVPPPPSIIDQQPAPAAVESKPAQEPVKTVQPEAPKFDVSSVVKALGSKNLEEQTAAIEKIAEVGQLNNQDSAALINEEVFKGLSDIASKNTSKLPGKTAQQLELAKNKQAGKTLTPEEEDLLNKPSEKEIAEQNKIISMWTMAVLQKNLRDAINAQLAPADPKVPLYELPGIKQIEDNIKLDPNPQVRSAGIQALRYVAQPDDEKVISTILNTVIKTDKDPAVKADAQSTLVALPKAAPAAQPASKK